MTSPQTLSDDDRRVLARWAAACAERVVGLFEASAPGDDRVRDAVARTSAYGRGESTAHAEIRLRMVAVKAASAATTTAGAAAARSGAQASAVAHLGAHALGAAGYAVKAVALAHPGQPEVVDQEIAWQLAELTEARRAALRRLPRVGTPDGGPLGPGLLSRGQLGDVIGRIQDAVGWACPEAPLADQPQR